MKNKYYLTGSIFTIINGLLSEFILYLMYVLFSCVYELAKQNGGEAKDPTGIFVLLGVLAVGVLCTIVLAIITLIKSVRAKKVPLAMIIFQIVVMAGVLIFAVYAFISALISGGDEVFQSGLMSIVLFGMSAVSIIMYSLGIKRASNDKKKMQEEQGVIAND